jgi:hypothetical protein
MHESSFFGSLANIHLMAILCFMGRTIQNYYWGQRELYQVRGLICLGAPLVAMVWINPNITISLFNVWMAAMLIVVTLRTVVMFSDNPMGRFVDQILDKPVGQGH